MNISASEEAEVFLAFDPLLGPWRQTFAPAELASNEGSLSFCLKPMWGMKDLIIMPRFRRPRLSVVVFADEIDDKLGRFSMTIMFRTVAAGLLLLSAGSASATPPPVLIDLYPAGTVKPLDVPEIREDPNSNGNIQVRNVSVPTLEIFRPEPGAANGIAVIVAPGGGFVTLDYDNEGTSVAKRLATQGVTAFVLKYRPIQTATSFDQMMADHMSSMEELLKRAKNGTTEEVPTFPGENLARDDAARAVQLIRHRAAEWSIDPRRVGFVGFSAGSFLAVDVAIGEKASRPDFVGFIYGGLRTPVPADAPPAFIAAAADDPLLPNDAIQLYGAWKAAGRDAELHVYERGGHGFGMTVQGTTSDQWFDEFVRWMQSRGLYKPSVPHLAP